MTLRTLLFAATSALTLSACATVPASLPPPTNAAVPSGPFVSATPGAVTPTALPPDWWRLYNDPVLDGLIDEANVQNTDVRQAVARIERARASLRGARADRTPQAQLSTSAGYGRTPPGQAAAGFDRDGALFSIGADITYELDLFGRISENVAAARGDLAAAQADADAVRVMVIGDTTQAYAAAASAAARLETARSIVALLDETVRLTRKRHDAGLADGLAVARIETLREQRASAIPAIEAQRSAALFALATLTGRAPSQLPVIAGERSVPLEIAAPIPVGDGSQLLARRPDVRAAEQRFMASSARIGVARADLYPRITLGGSATSTAQSISDLFSGGPLSFLLGPLINWAFPNREPIRARIDAANADASGALAAFDGTVLTALQETETALSAYARSLEQRRALAAAQAAAMRAVKITRAQNREGVVDSLQTLDAERTLAEARAALADQDAAVSAQQIAVFRALGGGWSVTAMVATRLAPLARVGP
ncbi:NodT family efflux transporter outer membrane factor (OMF) lipoprotein [Novosphingobium hassiacum]|uniref:NodT family efflux transporter outer membrane factor (OMF) lipoprotein n=1 Tax=Novosphingobium hassiacum TaxID=173676 RepID=A0A7W6EVQ4_9SPHN|nr:TolC family protein [Novosphingobium hassiacum]MBB3860195.1 NodT family efflux transporter outer membrane factor (OMF) lipoprotein [Novosphingobium hassiacum]